MTGYSIIGYTRIPSTIGKKVENYKVQLRKLKMDLEYRNKKDDLNKMDRFLLNNGEDIIKRGYSSLYSLKNIDYISIIKRSMKRSEICLGRTDECNLRKTDAIEIGKLKNASYNLLEEDAYIYLKKVRRRNKDLNIDYYIDEFISINKLNKNSRDYIKILLNIPSDTLRQWIRYKDGKRKNSLEKELEIIKKTSEYENLIL